MLRLLMMFKMSYHSLNLRRWSCRIWGLVSTRRGGTCGQNPTLVFDLIQIATFLSGRLAQKNGSTYFRQFLAFGDELIYRLRITVRYLLKVLYLLFLLRCEPLNRHQLSVSQPPDISPPQRIGEKLWVQVPRPPIPSKKAAVTCKFFGNCEHSSLKCTKIVHNARIEMTKEKGLCFHCLSSGHGWQACPGARGRLDIECFFCKGTSHVTPLYTKAVTWRCSSAQLFPAPSFIVSNQAVTTNSLPA